MSAGQADVMKWWFCFRVKGSPGSRPGGWVVRGPFDTYEEAEAARAKSKAPDAEVTPPFSASSREAAQARCDADKSS